MKCNIRWACFPKESPGSMRQLVGKKGGRCLFEIMANCAQRCGPTLAPPGGHTLTMPQTVNMMDFIPELCMLCGMGNLWKENFSYFSKMVSEKLQNLSEKKFPNL